MKFKNKTPADVILDALRSTLGPDRQEEIKLKELDNLLEKILYNKEKKI